MNMAPTRQAVLDDIQARLGALLRTGPAADLERNAKAMLAQGFQRLELVTREEFELQREMLARARARLEQLEARVAELEHAAMRPASPQPAGVQPAAGTQAAPDAAIVTDPRAAALLQPGVTPTTDSRAG